MDEHQEPINQHFIEKIIDLFLRPCLLKFGINQAAFMTALFQHMEKTQTPLSLLLFETYLEPPHKNLMDLITETLATLLQAQENEIINSIHSSLFDYPTLLSDFLSAYHPKSYVQNKLFLQAKLYQLMLQYMPQKHQGISFHDIWKFMIDGRNHSTGAYSYENEPGYILNTFNGWLSLFGAFHESRKTQHPMNPLQYRDAIWLEDIHKQFFENTEFLLLKKLFSNPHIENCFEDIEAHLENSTDRDSGSLLKKSSLFRNDSEENSRHVCYGIEIDQSFTKKEFDIFTEKLMARENWISFEIITDHDSHDQDDEKERYTESVKIILKHKSRDDIIFRVNHLFHLMRIYYNHANNDYELLLTFIYLFKEIEFNHVFLDGNLRLSLAIFNALLFYHGFPLVVFENPNQHTLKSPSEFFDVVIDAMKRSPITCEEKIQKILADKASSTHYDSWDEFESSKQCIVTPKMKARRFELFRSSSKSTLNELPLNAASGAILKIIGRR
jgi:hypothetical protein